MRFKCPPFSKCSSLLFSPPKQASQRRINIHFIHSGGKKERFIRCSLHPGLYLLLSNLEPGFGFVRKAIFTCKEMIGFFFNRHQF